VLRWKTSSVVREKKSATGWPGTSIPTASISTMPLTRGDFSSAISAVIQPPMELPMTDVLQADLVQQRVVERGEAGDGVQRLGSGGVSLMWY
jgi:hypothetical protein